MKIKISRRMGNFLKLLLGLLILSLLIYTVGVGDYLSVLKEIDLFWFILSVIVATAGQLILGVNLKMILKSLGRNLPFFRLLRYGTYSLVLGSVSPGRAGELGLLFFLKKREGIPYGEGLAVMLMDKFISIFVLLVLSIYGLYRFLGVNVLLIVFLGFLLLASLFFFLVHNRQIKGLIKRYLLKDKAKYFKSFSKSFIYAVKYGKRYLVLNGVFTLIKWLITFVSLYFLFFAFNTRIPFYLLVVIFSLTSLVSIIPFSFGGLGFSEVTGVYLLKETINLELSVGANILLMGVFKKYIIYFVFYLYNLNLLKERH